MIAFWAASSPTQASGDEPESKVEAEDPAAEENEGRGDGADGSGDAQPSGSDASGDERSGADQADVAAAQSLLKVGQRLMSSGQLEQACEKLKDSVAAHFIPEAGLLLAECQEKRGLIASAWASYRSAATKLRNLGDARAATAQTRADALNVKVPRLTIAATTVPGMEIVRGETRFRDGVLGVPLAVDPGTHRIEARAPGYESWVGEVTIQASEQKTIQIPDLKKKAPSATSATTTRVVAKEHGALWTAGLITGAAGLVTIGVGALLGGLAAAEINEAEEDETLCGANHVCTPAGIDQVETAEGLAVGSTVLFAVGGAALLGGFIMVLVDDPEPSSEMSVNVMPWLGPGGAGMGIGGSF